MSAFVTSLSNPINALLAALSDALPRWRARPSGGGLHGLVELPGDLDEPRLLAAAARHGVGLEGLSLHSYTGDCPAGLVLGHAHMAEPALERGVRLLAQAPAATSAKRTS